MTEDILVIDTDCGSISTQVNKGATRSFLSIGQHTVGQGQRSEIHLGNGYTSQIEALIQIAVEHLAPQDIEEVTFQSGTLNTHGIQLVLVVHLILLGGCIQNLLILIAHVTVCIHQLIHHLLCDDGVGSKILDDDVFDASYRLTSDTHIDL